MTFYVVSVIGTIHRHWFMGPKAKKDALWLARHIVEKNDGRAIADKVVLDTQERMLHALKGEIGCISTAERIYP